VTAKVSSTYYPYKEVDRQEDAESVVITLELVKLDRQAYGKSSIAGLRLEGEGEATVVRFVDQMPFYHVNTQYHLMILDGDGQKVVDGPVPVEDAVTPLRTFSVPLVPGDGSMGDHVFEILKGYVDYKLVLSVTRDSVLLPEGPLSFRIEAKRRGVLDNRLFDRPTLADFRLVERNGRIYLKIVDLAAGHERVNVHYSLKIHRKIWLVSDKVVARAEWDSDGSKEMLYLLSKGANNPVAAGLRESMDEDRKYRLRLRVHRTSPLLTGGQVAFEIKKKMEPK